ncbi:MAG: nucleotide exchange factor GrpE [Spirochaetia bacterium]|nr:nucleotide exchange factor GrpE [Spirochaetia bacterium]
MGKEKSTTKDKNDDSDNIENSSSDDNEKDFTPLEFSAENGEGSIDQDTENLLNQNEQKIIELNEEIARLNDSILREKAEFLNYRKRMNQENLQQEGRTAGKILQELIPVFDAFDLLLATEHNGDKAMEKFLDGSNLIRKQLWQVFENLGIELIDPDQQEFDPTSMEALSVSESEKTDKEIVKQVYQKGYRYKDRILRPARVAVEKPKSQVN